MLCQQESVCSSTPAHLIFAFCHHHRWARTVNLACTGFHMASGATLRCVGDLRDRLKNEHITTTRSQHSSSINGMPSRELYRPTAYNASITTADVIQQHEIKIVYLRHLLLPSLYPCMAEKAAVVFAFSACCGGAEKATVQNRPSTSIFRAAVTCRHKHRANFCQRFIDALNMLPRIAVTTCQTTSKWLAVPDLLQNHACFRWRRSLRLTNRRRNAPAV